jgi:hypothetical protein
MVEAAARHSVFEGEHRNTSRLLLYKISTVDWDQVQFSDNFWITGDKSYRYREYGGGGSMVTARHFDVRFEPQGVRAIVGNIAKEQPAEQRATEPSQEPESKKPRVSDAHLQAWFEFYRKVHTEVEDTEDRAAEFARICFPGKSVSRDRIRALRGSLKRGPKKKLYSAE